MFSRLAYRTLSFRVLGARALALGALALGVPPLAACSSGGTEELFEPGPYPVGFRETSLTYLPVASSEERTLPVQLWYPAEGGEPATYRVAGVVDVPSDALDAPPIAPGGAFPVAVYSHGSGGIGLLAYPFAERLASHGWVVAAVDHVGNTALEVIGGSGQPFARNALNRPGDVTALIDWIESDAVAGLAASADTTRVLAFGHSFGAYTTLAAGGADLSVDALRVGCEEAPEVPDCAVLAEPDVEAAYRAGFGDPRVAAIAPQAPALVTSFRAGELAALEVPTMLMTGRLDQTTTQEEQAVPAWAGLDGQDDLWVEMPQGGHLSFISVCYDLDAGELSVFQPGAFDDGCGDGFIDARLAVDTLAAYLLAFGRLHIEGDESMRSILRGPPLEDGFVVTAR
ncbi:MAG: alpha/beta hydrolase family protein [Sandaracinaceae bacterium]